MTGGALRHALRLPAFTATTVALALAAHAAQGAVLPRPGPLVVAVLVVVALGAAFTHRERGFGAILVAVGTAQVGLHVALGGSGAHPAHLWSATAAHVVAAVVTACLLRRGEAGAWAALRRVVRAVRLAEPLRPAVTGRRTHVPAGRVLRPRTTWQRRPAALRAPPAPVPVPAPMSVPRSVPAPVHAAAAA